HEGIGMEAEPHAARLGGKAREVSSGGLSESDAFLEEGAAEAEAHLPDGARRRQALDEGAAGGRRPAEGPPLAEPERAEAREEERRPVGREAAEAGPRRLHTVREDEEQPVSRLVIREGVGPLADRPRDTPERTRGAEDRR